MPKDMPDYPCVVCGKMLAFGDEWFAIRGSYVHSKNEQIQSAGMVTMIICPDCFVKVKAHLTEA